MKSDIAILGIGYFGKVPGTGDFVSKGMNPKTRDHFDTWLQKAIAESKEQLGESWLHSFLTAPIWRFLINDVSESPACTLGIMIPSVDKVGRYFPFALFIELESSKLAPRFLARADDTLHQFEETTLSVLNDDFDIDYFDFELRDKAKTVAETSIQNDVFQSRDEIALTSRLNEIQAAGGSVWWTEGSDHRLPDLAFYAQMPPTAAFASFLRDPNVFADFEETWENVKLLGSNYSHNADIELRDVFQSYTFSAMSHHGANDGTNLGYAEFDAKNSAVVISDGRFGTASSAMVSRFLCRHLPKLWQAEGCKLNSSKIELLVDFLDQKIISAEHSPLLPPLSFACIIYNKNIQDELHVLASGDYHCLKMGRHGMQRILESTTDMDGPTVRRRQNGRYRSLVLKMGDGETILLGSAVFGLESLNARLDEILKVQSSRKIAELASQTSLIQGIQSNIALIALRRQEKASSSIE